MKDEELRAMIDSARIELARRELRKDGKVLVFEEEGISVYLTGDFETNVKGDIEIGTIVINETDKGYRIFPAHMTISVNGWDVAAYVGLSANPGQKAKGVISFSPEDAGITSADEVQDLVFDFAVLFDGEEKWKSLGPYAVHFDR